MRNPNIVFIVADDMGIGDVGCYNAKSRIPTPHMDALAARGIRFTDAHAPSAVCTPTRYGVLTGRYCWRTSLSEGVLGSYSPPLIETSRLTVASMMKKKGYATACIGKWHVGLDFQDSEGNVVHDEQSVDFSKPVLSGPADLGFDYAYYNAACGTCAPPYGFIEGRSFVDSDFSFFGTDRDDEGRGPGMTARSWVTKEADVIIAEKACEYIKQREGEDDPFFIYLTPNAPHEPCMEEYVPEFARGKSEAGARGDLVWLFDWTVGEVVRTLEETKQFEDTLIIVTSDNGALPGDFVRDENGVRVDAGSGKREFVYTTYGHESGGIYKGYKAHIWEGGHREALIASWPGRIAPGSESEETVCLTDLMATCADIAGVDLPNEAGEDSVSVLPALLGDETKGMKAGKPIREATVHHSSFGVFSIRKGRWKLVLGTKSSGGWPTPRGDHPVDGAPGQLYDVVLDPGEENDLYEDRPNIVSYLGRLLEKYQTDGRSVPERC